jgi:hypothetical protein
MKRKNPVEIGRKLELAAAKHIQGQDWKVHRTIRNSYQTAAGPRSNGNDVFGAVDLIGKKSGERTLWLQITKHTTVRDKIEALEAIPWDDRFDDVQIWRWVGAEGKRDSHFFQVYKRSEGYEFRAENRIRPLKSMLKGPDENGVRT